MGTPYHEAENIIKAHQVAVFSSNYTLYGDLSDRVMKTLAEFTPELEIYSIDEAFLSLRGFSSKDLSEYGREIKETVYRYTGIPVSVGIAPTKVLAKAANKIAKKQDTGVYALNTEEHIDQALSHLKVEDLWGIADRSSLKLNRIGISTAKELRDAPERVIQKLLTIVGRRIQDELRGKSCLPLDLVTKVKKQIISSRSFGALLTDQAPISEAIASHVTRAGEKLRKQNSVCSSITVFLHTNPFREQDAQYYNQTTRTFNASEDRTPKLIEAALDALDEIYRDGFKYKKAGVIFHGLTPKEMFQPTLFEDSNRTRDDTVMSAVDRINRLMGPESIKFASCGTKKHWKMRSEKRSPRYTTSWDELLCVG